MEGASQGLGWGPKGRDTGGEEGERRDSILRAFTGRSFQSSGKTTCPLPPWVPLLWASLSCSSLLPWTQAPCDTSLSSQLQLAPQGQLCPGHGRALS